MPGTTYLDASEIIETFDPEEGRSMITSQLELLDDDACEIMTDNFKLLYMRYASLVKNRESIGAEAFDDAQARFFTICEIFIEEISKKIGFSMDHDYLDAHYNTIPAITLPIYFFFVLDLRSNTYNVLLSFIYKNTEAIWEHFKDRLNKHDSITTVNRTSVEDQTMALIMSNIYDVVDWCLGEMSTEVFLENMEPGYAILDPINGLIEEGGLLGMETFVDSLRDIIKQNVALKARICFDLICKMKGYQLES